MGLRIYEPHGARGLTTLRFSLPVQRIERVDLLEDPADRPAAALGYDGRTCPSTCRSRSLLSASFSRPDPMVLVWAQAVRPLPGRCRSRYGAGVVDAGVASAVSAATSPVANPWMRSAVIFPSARS
jgi:hypothetical protein